MMGWDIDEQGLGLVLARDIPSFVLREFSPVIDDFLNANNISQRARRTSLSYGRGAR